MTNDILWRMSDGKITTDYIRANSMDEAGEEFSKRHYGKKAVEFQPIAEQVHAVYFTDNPSFPAFFRGTRTEAEKGGRLYIKQWQLDATIDRIVTI
jgi:hypothetical protein